MINLNAEHLDVVKRILRAHLPEVEARVFGSRLDEQARPFSDLDLALVGNMEIDKRRLEAVRDAFSESDLPIQVDVLDWHTISETFQKAIEKKYAVIQKGGRKKRDMVGELKPKAKAHGRKA